MNTPNMMYDINREAHRELSDESESRAIVCGVLERIDMEYRLRGEIAEVRKILGITQAELKKVSGLTQQTVSRIECDPYTSPSLRSVIRYISALGLELTIQPRRDLYI